jgi:NADPH-dependent 2,4-dienoyl-CoA reductase/sulfur reductase-like enzyme/nitrite reductase/ring-hydroxylating ferredoxin subunit
MGGSNELVGPDLEQGVDVGALADGGVLLGHAQGEPVLLARRGAEVLAVGARCSHYGGPLAEGLIVGDTVRCPWHHACFSLRTGEALAAPALNALSCWTVAERSGRLTVIGKAAARHTPAGSASHPSKIVILGGGAAGLAAAVMLRREGYAGALTLLSADESPPCDRPNLSKDYLAGNAQEEWIPLYPPEFYAEQGIDLVLGTRATALDVAGKRVLVEGGRSYAYDALLLATGADPVPLRIPGAEQPHVRTLRTLADSRAIIERLGTARRAVVVGASFIGLEVAASLRTRNLEVDVVAPEARPLERVLGPELGDHVRRIHESHGVRFHLGHTLKSIDARSVLLDSGEELAADLVVAGIGVRPALELAEAAGLRVDRGVLVDQYLETSAPGVFAAGDIARWPDPRWPDARLPDPERRESLRVEHWVVAERLGQVAARNMLGRREPCSVVPFFWSQHYDVAINYVGHAERWDRIDLEGNLAQNDCRVIFMRGGRALAVVTLGRDLESLRAEREMELSRA